MGEEKIAPRTITPYILLAPILAFVIVFLVLPLILVGVVSLYRASGAGYEQTLTFNNYIRFFSDPNLYGILLNTLANSAIVTIFAFILAYPVAYFLTMKIKTFRAKTILLIAMLIPFWIDFTTRSLSWIPWLGIQGIINQVLTGLGILKEPSPIFLFSPFAMILVMIQGYTLFMIAPIFIVMSKIDPTLYEAAKALGASPLKVFYHINLKLCLPGIGVGTVFVFLSSVADFATPRLIGGLVTSIGQVIRDQVVFLNLPLAAATSVILTLIALAIVFTVFNVMNIRQVFE
ncbi:Spermidine/putrescine transport system permease protein PotB [archaeon HR01]|nr:Spermidine/putrescine transport system permease protein PotB [archaeon HR01]